MTETQRARSVLYAARALEALPGCTMACDCVLWPSGTKDMRLGLRLGEHTALARECFEMDILGALYLAILEVEDLSGPVVLPYMTKWGLDTSDVLDVLETHLGANAVALLETAYERGNGFYQSPGGEVQDVDTQNAGVTQDDWGDAVVFGSCYDDDRDRARAILGNLIDNMGQFTPGEQRIQ